MNAVKNKDIINTAFIEVGIAFWNSFVEKCRSIAAETLRSKGKVDFKDTCFGRQDPYAMLSDDSLFVPECAKWNGTTIVVEGTDKESGKALSYNFDDMAQDAITLSDFMHAILGEWENYVLPGEKEEQDRDKAVKAAMRMFFNWSDIAKDKMKEYLEPYFLPAETGKPVDGEKLDKKLCKLIELGTGVDLKDTIDESSLICVADDPVPKDFFVEGVEHVDMGIVLIGYWNNIEGTDDGGSDAIMLPYITYYPKMSGNLERDLKDALKVIKKRSDDNESD